jgi:pimeloyl-ACP methyl ester carboxylesterase
MSIFVSFDGTQLHYDTVESPDPTGSADGPLVVLAGGPGTDARYLGDLGGLSRVRPLVRLHARASGLSQLPEDTPAARASCAFAAQAADVEALRRHLGLERLDLLAHSAGALVGQHYAALHPERVRRLVLVTPVGRAARETDQAEIAALRAARSGEPWYPAARKAELALEQGGLSGVRALAEQVRLLPFFWGTWSDQVRATEYAGWLVPQQPWIREAFYTGSTATPPPVEVPVLVVAGGRDGMIGTAPARRVAAHHPRARLEVLAHSGHRPWAEQPERFTELVRTFLADPQP